MVTILKWMYHEISNKEKKQIVAQLMCNDLPIKRTKKKVTKLTLMQPKQQLLVSSLLRYFHH